METTHQVIDLEFGPHYTCFPPYLYWDHEPDIDYQKLWAECPRLKAEHEKMMRVEHLDIDALLPAPPELEAEYAKLMQDEFGGSPDRMWEELHDGLLMSGIDIDPISPDPAEKIKIAVRIAHQYRLDNPDDGYDPTFDANHVWFGIAHVQAVEKWIAAKPETDGLLKQFNQWLRGKNKRELTAYDLAVVALILRKNILTTAGACSYKAIRSFTEQCGGLIAKPLSNPQIKAALQTLEALGFHWLEVPGSHAERRCNTYTLSHIGAIQDIFAAIDSGMPPRAA